MTLLFPVLIFTLWLEVEAGVSFTWGALVGYVSPSQPHVVAGMLLGAGTIIGPMSTIATTCWSRCRSMNNVERLLRVEVFGLMIALPVVAYWIVIALGASAL